MRETMPNISKIIGITATLPHSNVLRWMTMGNKAKQHDFVDRYVKNSIRGNLKKIHTFAHVD